MMMADEEAVIQAVFAMRKWATFILIGTGANQRIVALVSNAVTFVVVDALASRGIPALPHE